MWCIEGFIFNKYGGWVIVFGVIIGWGFDIVENGGKLGMLLNMGVDVVGKGFVDDRNLEEFLNIE